MQGAAARVACDQFGMSNDFAGKTSRRMIVELELYLYF